MSTRGTSSITANSVLQWIETARQRPLVSSLLGGSAVGLVARNFFDYGRLAGLAAFGVATYALHEFLNETAMPAEAGGLLSEATFASEVHLLASDVVRYLKDADLQGKARAQRRYNELVRFSSARASDDPANKQLLALESILGGKAISLENISERLEFLKMYAQAHRNRTPFLGAEYLRICSFASSYTGEVDLSAYREDLVLIHGWLSSSSSSAARPSAAVRQMHVLAASGTPQAAASIALAATVVQAASMVAKPAPSADVPTVAEPAAPAVVAPAPAASGTTPSVPTLTPQQMNEQLAGVHAATRAELSPQPTVVTDSSSGSGGTNSSSVPPQTSTPPEAPRVQISAALPEVIPPTPNGAGTSLHPPANASAGTPPQASSTPGLNSSVPPLALASSPLPNPTVHNNLPPPPNATTPSTAALIVDVTGGTGGPVNTVVDSSPAPTPLPTPGVAAAPSSAPSTRPPAMPFSAARSTAASGQPVLHSPVGSTAAPAAASAPAVPPPAAQSAATGATAPAPAAAPAAASAPAVPPPAAQSAATGAPAAPQVVVAAPAPAAPAAPAPAAAAPAVAASAPAAPQAGAPAAP